MYVKLSALTLLLLQVVHADPTAKVILQQDFTSTSNWSVSVEEPRFDDEKYTSIRCNATESYLNCTASFSYKIFDDEWYEKRCDVDIPLSRHSVNKELRLTTLQDKDATILSFSVYSKFELDRIKHTELNRIDWRDCSVLESNRIMKIGENVYDIIPYADSFDFINKANQSFDARTSFKYWIKGDDGDEVKQAMITYPYEKPQEYREFQVYPIRRDGSSGYFFIYDFVQTLKVYVADTNGKITRGKKLLQKYLANLDGEDYRFRDVHHSVIDDRILVCAHIWLDVTYVSYCTLLDEKLNVKWEFEYNTNEVEVFLGVRLLKNEEVILVTDHPDLDSDKIRLYKVDKVKNKKSLYEIEEKSFCEDTGAIEFGRTYEVKGRACFSTYCKRDERIRRWSATCFTSAAPGGVVMSAGVIAIAAVTQMLNYFRN